MRKIIIVLICCISILMISCAKRTVLVGTAFQKGAKKIRLYTFDKGVVVALDSASIRQNGGFNFTLQLPYEGLFLLGMNDKVLFPIYLKNGEQVDLEFFGEHYFISGKQSFENKLLTFWEKKVSNVRLHSFLHDYIPGGHSIGCLEFFQELDSLFIVQKELLLELDKKKNNKFCTWFKNKIRADLAFFSLAYLRNQELQIPDTIDLPICYKEMNPDVVFQDVALLELPYVGNMLETYVWFVSQNTENKDKYDVSCLCKKELQQECLISVASHFKYYNQYLDLIQEVGENFFTSANQKRLDVIKNKLLWSAPGNVAPDFEGMKPDSTWLALSDFRGKVVVVDVWATWCAPCRRMMPYFQSLEKNMTDQNIVFISVCMGVSIERDVWLKIIEEDKLEGNMCFIDSWTGKFAKDYRITGVPRYMIFDKDGRIVSVAAPNPTTSKLKEMIEDVLNK